VAQTGKVSVILNKKLKHFSDKNKIFPPSISRNFSLNILYFAAHFYNPIFKMGTNFWKIFALENLLYSSSYSPKTKFFFLDNICV